MKPRTLARYAIQRIEDGTFVFDTPERKKEALRQMRTLSALTVKNGNNNPKDPIVEFYIGVFIPNFDYPIIPVDDNDDPVVWEEDGTYEVPGKGTHVFKGIGLSGEAYYMSYVEDLSPYRDADIKVDKYTNLDRAAYAMVCSMCQIIDKKGFARDHGMDSAPVKMEYDALIEHWKGKDKEFADKQHKQYIKWLQGWISIHGKNPETHMRVLKMPKKQEIEVS